MGSENLVKNPSAVWLFVFILLAAGCDSSSSGSSVVQDSSDSPDTVSAPDATDDPDASTPNDVPTTDTGDPTVNEALVVVSTAPAGGAIASPTDPVVVTFNQDVNATSLNDETVTLSGPDGVVPGQHAVEGAVYTFTPDAPLLGDSAYTFTLDAGVKPAGQGESLDGLFALSFTTVPGMNVVSVEPSDGAEGVATSAPVRIVFDRPVTRKSVNIDTVQIITSGWIDGVWYDFEPLPGEYRVLDENGLTVDEGTMVQWYVDTQALPEYQVRHDVVVTRGVRAADGSVLDANFESSFRTELLSGDFTYTLRVDGLGDGQSLGLDTTGNLAEMTDSAVPNSFDWYVVYLNDGQSVGLWNSDADKALRENGLSNGVTLEDWQGISEQAFKIEQYGGSAGADTPYQSPFLYYITPNTSPAECLKAETATSGQTVLFVRPQDGNIYSLWYFIRGPKK